MLQECPSLYSEIYSNKDNLIIKIFMFLFLKFLINLHFICKMYFIKKLFVLSIIVEYISNGVSLPNRSTRDIEQNDKPPLETAYVKKNQETLKEQSKQHIAKHKTLEDIDHSHIIQKKTLIYSTNKLLYCIPEKKQIFAIERFMISEENFMCSDKNIEIYFEYHDFFNGNIDTKKRLSFK